MTHRGRLNHPVRPREQEARKRRQAEKENESQPGDLFTIGQAKRHGATPGD